MSLLNPTDGVGRFSFASVVDFTRLVVFSKVVWTTVLSGKTLSVTRPYSTSGSPASFAQIPYVERIQLSSARLSIILLMQTETSRIVGA